MQGPLVDLVVLAFLVLLFGLQLRTRPRLIFRFWFAGWILLFCSLLTWEFVLHDPWLSRLQEVLFRGTLDASGLAFMTSFVVRPGKVVRCSVLAVLVFVPALLVIGAVNLTHAPFWVLASLFVLGEAAAIFVTLQFPKKWKTRRVVVVVACLLFGAWLIYQAYTGVRESLPEWVEAEIFLCTAMLFAGWAQKDTLGRLVGSLGFFSWGLAYAVATQLTSHPRALRMLYDFWNVPKYAVAFAMILTISEESAAEAEEIGHRFRLLYEDFKILYEDHPHPMWVYDPLTQLILSVNRAAIRMYGYTTDEFQGMRLSDLEVAGGETAAEARQRDRDAIALTHRRKDGSELSVELTDHAILFQGEEARFALALDVTEKERLNRELIYRAQHDVLTGLPNRMMLDDKILECLARSTRDDSKAVLFTIDADRFKQVNDTYGHLIGDECLKAVAARLRSRIRQVDVIARTGGEEFTAMIGGLKSQEDAETIAASLLSLFDEPIALSGLELPLTISIGGALFPDDAVDVDTLRRKSDQALYQAKRTGRNRVSFADEAGAPAQVAATA